MSIEQTQTYNTDTEVRNSVEKEGIVLNGSLLKVIMRKSELEVGAFIFNCPVAISNNSDFNIL